MRLALYQPEIAPNVGACIRIAACVDAGLDIIEPCGFPLKSREMRKAALDYGALAEPVHHSSWSHFADSVERRSGRLVLLTTKSEVSLYDVELRSEDIFMIGQESAGVPDHVHAASDVRVKIPIAASARSLNMSVAAAIALSEARRQLTGPGRP